jgi:hypothetical protein
MAIAISFSPTNFTRQQYQTAIRELERAGAGTPPGRRYHACHGVDGQLQVFDVWDDAESFQQFAGTLAPILQRLGVDETNPVITELHNTIPS